MSTAPRNPFDDPEGRFLVLDNAREELSLWPDFAPIPAGWQAVFGPDTLAACSADVEQRWNGALRPSRVSSAA